MREPSEAFGTCELCTPMRHKKTGDLRLFPLPHASMFWKFIKNWEAYLLAPGLHCRGRGGWAAWSPPENTRKMPQSMEMCFRGMWSVHRMSCILLAVCLRNLFIYSVSIFFFEALLLPAPPLVRYSFTWPRHMANVPHRSSRGTMAFIPLQNDRLHASL